MQMKREYINGNADVGKLPKVQHKDIKIIKQRLWEKKSKLRKSNLHIIWVMIGRLETICLEIMNKILSELMKDSKLQEVNLVEKKKINVIPHLETW